MRCFFALFFLFVFSDFYAGNGFLGKSSQLGINAAEIITQQKFNITYDYMVGRNSSIGCYVSYLNRDYGFSDFTDFSYLAVTPASSDRVSVEGSDFFVRFCGSSPFQNKMLPLGVTYGISMGVGRYTAHEILGALDQTSTRYSWVYDFFLRNTFQVYRGMNFFYGINAGYVNSLASVAMHIYPPRSVNSAVMGGDNFFELLYFNVNYGLSFTL